MDERVEDVDAMTMTESNPLYVKYLKVKDDFLKKQKHIIDSDVSELYNPKSNPSSDYTDEDKERFIYLCYITRRYFWDNFLISIMKILIGIFSIAFAVYIERISGSVYLKGILMMGFFMYGLIMIPLSCLYSLANFVCFRRYLHYVTTPSSVLSKKIIHFYDEDTDKFQAVNWTAVFKRDSTDYHEYHRKKGW